MISSIEIKRNVDIWDQVKARHSAEFNGISYFHLGRPKKKTSPKSRLFDDVLGSFYFGQTKWNITSGIDESAYAFWWPPAFKHQLPWSQATLRDAESTVHKSWCNLHPMLTGYTQWCFLAVFLFTDGFLDGFFSTLPFPRPIAEVEVDPFPLPLPSMSLRSWHDALSTFDPCTTLRVAKSQVVYLPDAASSVLMAS